MTLVPISNINDFLTHKKSLKTEARRHIRAAEKSGKIFYVGGKENYIDGFVHNNMAIDKSKLTSVDINRYCK